MKVAWTEITLSNRKVKESARSPAVMHADRSATFQWERRAGLDDLCAVTIIFGRVLIVPG